MCVDLHYQPRQFSAWYGAALANPGRGAYYRLPSSYLEHVWALITVGHIPRTLRAHPTFLLTLFEHRRTLIDLYFDLRHDGAGRYVLAESSEWDLLDPSEKAHASYFAGLMAAKILSANLHAVPHLMHLDVYEDALNPGFWHLDDCRPDLVGRDRRGDWHVIEAKGRARSPGPSDMARFKRQTYALRTIQGSNPALRVVSATFRAKNGAFRTYWRDPPAETDDSDEGWNLETSASQFLRRYYQPLAAAVSESGMLDVVEIPGAGGYMTAALSDQVRIGLSLDILRAVNEDDAETLVRVVDSRPFESSTYVMPYGR